MLIVAIIYLLLSIDGIMAILAVNRVVVRVPKENDIGLIFDMGVVNAETNNKGELLEYRVRSDGSCFLNLTEEGCLMRDAGRIVGGNFGFIEAGTTQTISLVWPTKSLYNRVGFCPVVITSVSMRNEQLCLKKMLFFDTRFKTLDPDCRLFQQRADFQDCKNWDLEYFKNCTPVDCEERYFGRRSFWNPLKARCEKTTPCQEFEVYDMYTNECTDNEDFFSDCDIQKIKAGKFMDPDAIEKCQAQSGVPRVVVNTFDEEKQPDPYEIHNFHKRQSNEDEDDYELDDYAEAKASRSSSPSWFKGLADGLMLVFATLAIYILICSLIYVIVTWICRLKYKPVERTTQCSKIISPTSSGHIAVYTTPSLLSQR